MRAFPDTAVENIWKKIDEEPVQKANPPLLIRLHLNLRLVESAWFATLHPTTRLPAAAP
jgi:hypothetical protein